MSITVEERIRRYAQDLDVAVEERRVSSDEATHVDLPISVAVTESHSTRRTRRTLVAASVCVILAAGAAVAIVRGHREQRHGVAPATGSDWLVPNDIDGYHLWFAQSLQNGVSYLERYRMQLARPTVNGGFTAPVTVTIGDSYNRLAGHNENQPVTTTPVEVNGQSAEIVEGSNMGRTVLQYQLSKGDAVVFADNADAVGDATRELLQQFAEAITPTSDGSLEVTGDLPADYRVLAAMNMQQEFGAAPDLTFIDNDNRQSLLFIDTEASTPPGYELLRIGSEVAPVEVRGVMGWITTDTDTADVVPATTGTVFKSPGSTVLFWREPTGQLVSINSTGAPNGSAAMTKDDLVAIANNLRPVTETDWQTFAQTADSTGEGVGAAVGPTQVAFPTPPAGYRLDFAHLDYADEIYGQARYISQDDPLHQPVIDVLLRRWSPATWQSHLDGDLRDNGRGTANGRRIINTSPGLPTSNPHQDAHAVAMQWTTDVIVEVVVHPPDHAPLGEQYNSQGLAELANSVNGVDFFSPGPVNQLLCTITLGATHTDITLDSKVGSSLAATIGVYTATFSILDGPRLQAFVADSAGSTVLSTTAGVLDSAGDAATPDGRLSYSCTP